MNVSVMTRHLPLIAFSFASGLLVFLYLHQEVLSRNFKRSGCLRSARNQTASCHDSVNGIHDFFTGAYFNG